MTARPARPRYRHGPLPGLPSLPGATNLFSEPGALEQVTDLAGDWFGRHFAQVSQVAAAA